MNCAIGAQVYAGWNTAAGAAAHEVLAATRKAVISVPLIPGLKALVARNTGDARWNNIRPPHLPLTAAQQTALFSGVRCLRADIAEGRLTRGGQPWWRPADQLGCPTRSPLSASSRLPGGTFRS